MHIGVLCQGVTLLHRTLKIMNCVRALLTVFQETNLFKTFCVSKLNLFFFFFWGGGGGAS